jgi:hypothetical protein
MNIDNPAAPASTPAEAVTPAPPAVEPTVPSNASPAPHLLRAPEPISFAHEAPAAAAPVVSVAPPPVEAPAADEVSFARPRRSSLGSARSRRFGMMAASIAVAACVGSALGAAGTAGVTKLMSRSEKATPPTPYIAKVVESSDDVKALREAVAQMRGNLKQVSDGLGALRTSVEASAKSPAALDKKLTDTIARLNEGVEKMERAQAEPVARLAKVIETLDRVERRTAQIAAADATGSVVPQTRPSQPPHPVQLGSPPQQLQVPPQARSMGPAVVEGWRLRRVTDGVALLEGPDRIIEVEAGEVIRGIGRVDDIKRMDGRWVVVTARGIIR